MPLQNELDENASSCTHGGKKTGKDTHEVQHNTACATLMIVDAVLLLKPGMGNYLGTSTLLVGREGLSCNHCNGDPLMVLLAHSAIH